MKIKNKTLFLLIISCFILCFGWFQFQNIEDNIRHPRTGYQNITMAYNLRFNGTLGRHIGKFTSSEIKEEDICDWDILIHTLMGQKQDCISDHLKSFRTEKYVNKGKGYRNSADLSDYLKRATLKILNQAKDDVCFYPERRDGIRLKEGAEADKWFQRLLNDKIMISSDGKLLLKEPLNHYDREKIRWFNISILKEQISPPFTNIRAKPVPTNLREPVYPAFLAAGMLLSRKLKETDYYLMQVDNDKMEENAVLARKLRLSKYHQIFILLMTAIIGMMAAWKISKNIAVAAICLFMIGFSPRLSLGTNILLAENLSAFLLILISYCLLALFERPGKGGFILSGIVLALMALTKAVYQYFWVFALIIFGCSLWRIPSKRKAMLSGSVLFFTLYFSITGAWIARNYYYLGVPSITYRGGLVLLYRSNLDMMNSKEYAASFFKSIPKMYGIDAEITGKRILGEDAFKRFERFNPEGFEMRTIQHQKGLQQDKELERQALRQIMSHPFRHVALSVPFGLRVMFAEWGIWSPFMFVVFFLGICVWIKKRQWKKLMFFCPVLYHFVMYASITSGLTRYYAPMIPVVIVGAVCFSHEMVANTFDRERMERWREAVFHCCRKV